MEKIKKDIMLIAGILLTALLLWLIPVFLSRDTPARIRIMQDGRVTGSYPLSEDRTVCLSYGDENYNLLLISDGYACISDADCPDKLCVKSGRIAHNGGSIICLPHKLVIEIVSEEEGDLDAVTY